MAPPQVNSTCPSIGSGFTDALDKRPYVLHPPHRDSAQLHRLRKTARLDTIPPCGPAHWVGPSGAMIEESG